MSLTGLATALFLPSLAVPAAEFDREVMEALSRDYGELGPVDTTTTTGGQALGFDAVLRSIESHHPMVEAAAAGVRMARGERLAADGGFDPKIGVKGQLTPTGYYDVSAVDAKVSQATPLWGLELDAGYRIGVTGDDDGLATYDERATLDGGELKGGLRLPLLRDGPIDARRADLRRSTVSLRSAEAELDRTGLSLVVAGAQSYWDWVAAGESYRVVRALVALAETRNTQLGVRIDAGDAAEIDRAENLRSLLKRRDALIKAERKLQKAAIKLSLFYRSRGGDPVVPSSSRLPKQVPAAQALPPDEREAGLVRAMNGRPEITVATAAEDRARVDAELANNGILPRVDLEFKFSQDFGTDPALNDSFSLKSLEPFEIKALVSEELPVLLRKGRGKAGQATAKLDAATAKLQFTREKLRAEVQDLWSELNAAVRRAQVAAQSANVAEVVAAAERVRLVEGATSPFILNLREQAAADARISEIDARASAQVALTAWTWLTMVQRRVPAESAQ